MDYNIAFLQELIAGQVEENTGLEYKAAASLERKENKMSEISKDVSAFANAAGGLLIYGISEDPQMRHLPGAIAGIDRTLISREWLEQIINNRIRPRINNLKIIPVPIPEDPEKLVFVVEIPAGETAHQADDKRYYRRHNFLVEAMFDHEVRDIMNRQKNPEISLEFEIARTPLPQNPAHEISGISSTKQEPFAYHLKIYARNKGRIYANYINAHFDFPAHCIHGNDYNQRNNNRFELIADNKVRDLVEPNGRYQLGIRPIQYGPARYEPLLPATRQLLHSLRINEYAVDHGNNFNWTVYADNADPKTGSAQFGDFRI